MAAVNVKESVNSEVKLTQDQSIEAILENSKSEAQKTRLGLQKLYDEISSNLNGEKDNNGEYYTLILSKVYPQLKILPQSNQELRVQKFALIHDWQFLHLRLAYSKKFPTQQREYITNLMILFENDIRDEFRAMVALEMAQFYYFKDYPKHFNDLPNCLELLEFAKKHVLETQQKYIHSLIEEINNRLEGKIPNTDEEINLLTQCYQHLSLENIGKHGIIPPKSITNGICLLSCDGSFRSSVSMNAINFKAKGNHRSEEQLLPSILDYLVADVTAGLDSIALERSFFANPKTKLEFENILKQRLENGVVFIFNHPEIKYTLEMSSCWEEPHHEGCPSSYIQAILSPSNIMPKVKLYFPNVDIIEVTNTEKFLTFDTEKDIRSLKTFMGNEKAIDPKVERNFNIKPYLGTYQFHAPNFRSGFEAYFKKYKPTKCMIHFVRMATKHDLEYLTGSLEQFLPYKSQPLLDVVSRKTLWLKAQALNVATHIKEEVKASQDLKTALEDVKTQFASKNGDNGVGNNNGLKEGTSSLILSGSQAEQQIKNDAANKLDPKKP